MAIVTDPRRVIKVKGNPVICRYMDLTRFISLLHKQALFFCRIDKLTDPFEGTYSTPTRQEMIDSMINQDKLVFGKAPHEIDLGKIESGVDSIISLAEKMKSFITVSCWHIAEQENALMWSSYSKNQEGVMIKSKYLDLLSSFGDTDLEIMISQVGYIDINQPVPFGNVIYPFLFKRNFYKDESELRCIYDISSQNKYSYEIPYAWHEEESSYGIYIPIDLNVLIHDVVVSPFTPPWYAELVKSIAEKYSLKKPVTKSALAK